MRLVRESFEEPLYCFSFALRISFVVEIRTRLSLVSNIIAQHVKGYFHHSPICREDVNRAHYDIIFGKKSGKGVRQLWELM